MTKDEENFGVEWWNHITEDERAYWLERAKSAVPADAWIAFRKENKGSVFLFDLEG